MTQCKSEVVYTLGDESIARLVPFQEKGYLALVREQRQ